MFSEIAEIKSIREQKSKLSEREKELTEPILTDLDMIGTLYRWFQEIISQKETFRLGNVTQRKKFIFIILFLYSPSTLAGGKMMNGLRNKLADSRISASSFVVDPLIVYCLISSIFFLKISSFSCIFRFRCSRTRSASSLFSSSP